MRSELLTQQTWPPEKKTRLTEEETLINNMVVNNLLVLAVSSYYAWKDEDHVLMRKTQDALAQGIVMLAQLHYEVMDLENTDVGECLERLQEFLGQDFIEPYLQGYEIQKMMQAMVKTNE